MDQARAQSGANPRTPGPTAAAASECDKAAASATAVSEATNPPQPPRKDTQPKIQQAKLMTATSTMHMLQVCINQTSMFMC